ncbi:tRNA (guanosine(37)-N1)-methyltransferase TrmD [Candidatus Uhrbacteria bacterium RIFCSPLOWO2_12_FULL_46_10]|uniref:tRNA (guanine-N(1)-)-methyltransferase n=1 Tax=Candidatus Uhrbacteria bacterium RIFCSPLOWO2_01_FULL_47_25 TaxID=1802402 RepID=A0A1F7UVW6_9BACT|nr:MAG: tRNA (guanine-N(1)-)-methyltransferase [Parcubacteria group bacterium GW2011_GWA2_46_9]OGL58871.1 MAG: tRNA (guanosine(37)-N1)-methyltransferase TrmD [Candidatus Uhrbacteria bacterium RIFCSPHIGHO2_01_FULL_46_23]OGL69397.1 MAG: tRNA (guanosine(37)-N1)-methyltransferase TrmD [Candidatus Uhrbacteria bacterium RIFCSPHIGHO2_02_FULL_47_29]OGL76483.1 MAG: tRNA (guanosine(37)-N1)-methyltransferase TrmD [Candidatus Uhrbacteria bacterium RIFCSPHIGHO2_12_FULL_46_13]OGL82442.1 MAG: tRNA (guanosine(
MRFHILTLFPKIFDSYFNESILKRAQQKKLITIKAHNIRDYTTDKHHTTDDTPYGGGAGMVMKAEPILRAMRAIERRTRNTERRAAKIILLSAKGKQFTQKTAYDWSRKYDELIFISGRYEGIDERVKIILSARGGSAFGGKANEISIGPYVTTDGDVAAMVIISAVARLLPGVIRLESLAEESHWNSLLLREAKARSYKPEAISHPEYPHFTRPEVITWQGKKYRVPKVLLSGDHKKIRAWRELQRKRFQNILSLD